MEHFFTDELIENGHTLVLVSSLSVSAFVMIELASGPPPGGHIEIRVTHPYDGPIGEALSGGADDKRRIPNIDGQAPKRFTVKASNGHSVWLRVSDKDNKTLPGRFRVIPVGT